MASSELPWSVRWDCDLMLLPPSSCLQKRRNFPGQYGGIATQGWPPQARGRLPTRSELPWSVRRDCDLTSCGVRLWALPRSGVLISPQLSSKRGLAVPPFRYDFAIRQPCRFQDLPSAFRSAIISLVTLRASKVGAACRRAGLYREATP